MAYKIKTKILKMRIKDIKNIKNRNATFLVIKSFDPNNIRIDKNL